MNYYVVTIIALIVTLWNVKTFKALLDTDRVAPLFAITMFVLYMMSVYMPFPHNGITERDIYPKTVVGNRIVNPIYRLSDVVIGKTYIVKDGDKHIEVSLDPEYKNVKNLTDNKLNMIDSEGNKYITWLEQIEGAIVNYKTPEDEKAEVELNTRLKGAEKWRAMQSFFILGLLLLFAIPSISPEIEKCFIGDCHE